MKATPDDQLRLLDLQALDTALDRLTHRRRTLPELAQIDELDTRVTRLGDDIVLLDTEDSDLQVGSPRELENLQSEIESLKRRQGDLEDAELEIMEKREVVQTRRDEIRAEREQTSTGLDAAEQRRDAAFAEIDAEHEKATAQRAEVAASLPAELLGLYEKIRPSSAGVGAAALHRGRCEGCHLQLNTTDVNRIREAPDDEVLRCEECRRILVRTGESGL